MLVRSIHPLAVFGSRSKRCLSLSRSAASTTGRDSATSREIVFSQETALSSSRPKKGQTRRLSGTNAKRTHRRVERTPSDRYERWREARKVSQIFAQNRIC